MCSPPQVKSPPITVYPPPRPSSSPFYRLLTGITSHVTVYPWPCILSWTTVYFVLYLPLYLLKKWNPIENTEMTFYNFSISCNQIRNEVEGKTSDYSIGSRDERSSHMETEVFCKYCNWSLVSKGEKNYNQNILLNKFLPFQKYNSCSKSNAITIKENWGHCYGTMTSCPINTAEQNIISSPQTNVAEGVKKAEGSFE